MTNVKISKLDENARLPHYGSEAAAGADLYALLEEPIEIAPGKTALIRTGLKMEIPEGYAGLIYARSGLATKKDLRPQTRSALLTATTEERSWWLF